jgi:hypothetical protein
MRAVAAARARSRQSIRVPFPFLLAFGRAGNGHERGAGSSVESTAVPDLRGKPMLDIATVTNRKNLRAEQEEFERLGFQRRDVWVDRDDKPKDRARLIDPANAEIYNREKEAVIKHIHEQSSTGGAP